MKARVPFKLRLQLLLNGWFITGIIVFLVGLPFVFLFVSPRIINDFKLNFSSQKTQGILVDISRTYSSSEENEIWEFTYEYTLPNEDRITSFSYSNGFFHLKTGDTVNIHYYPKSPYLSRIEGMRTTVYSVWFLLWWSISGLGLLFMLVGLRKSCRILSILSRGKPALGRLVSKRSTNVQINGNSQYKLTYEFVTKDRETITASTKTLEPSVLTDDAYEHLLYLPSKPERILVLDTQKPRIRKVMTDNFPEFSEPIHRK